MNAFGISVFIDILTNSSPEAYRGEEDAGGLGSA